MHKASSFNLLKFVERQPWLSFNKTLLILLVYIVVLISYFFIEKTQVQNTVKDAIQMHSVIQQSLQTLQPALQKGVGNPMVGILFTGSLKNYRDFYPEFSALSHIQVKGLWLTQVIIQRHPAFIKITGAMEASSQLDELLKQLSAEPVFQIQHFVVLNLKKGLLPYVPPQYEKMLAQLKIPTLYHFVIQTAPPSSLRVSS